MCKKELLDLISPSASRVEHERDTYDLAFDTKTSLSRLRHTL